MASSERDMQSHRNAQQRSGPGHSSPWSCTRLAVRECSCGDPYDYLLIQVLTEPEYLLSLSVLKALWKRSGRKRQESLHEKLSGNFSLGQGVIGP